MLKLVEVELVFIKEYADENKNPINIERKVKALAREKGAFSSYYYQGDKNRSMEVSNNLEFDKELLSEAAGHLRFLFFNGYKYKVINILKSKSNPRKIIADVERIQ